MILIVDDDHDIASLIKISLDKAGFFTSAFIDPLAALEEFSSHPDKYGLLISDIKMPCIDGYELAEQVKKINSGIKILLTSACERSSQHFTKDISHLDISGFIEKPISMAQLCKVVHTVIDNKPLQYGPDVYLQ
jgi:DNA-binding NtrC family response regulator